MPRNVGSKAYLGATVEMLMDRIIGYFASSARIDLNNMRPIRSLAASGTSLAAIAPRCGWPSGAGSRLLLNPRLSLTQANWWYESWD